jgi:Rrf2 family iron-sulfur cluster assembly transcriptional regulator
MQSITRTGEYGLRGLLFLTKQPTDRIFLVSEVSRAQRITATYPAKIFQRLSKTGLLKSTRGLNGGFNPGKPAKEITMKQVIEALEGPIVLNRCLLRQREYDEEESCPLHEVFEEAQEKFLEALDRTTIEDLARQDIRNERRGRR